MYVHTYVHKKDTKQGSVGGQNPYLRASDVVGACKSGAEVQLGNCLEKRTIPIRESQGSRAPTLLFEFFRYTCNIGTYICMSRRRELVLLGLSVSRHRGRQPAMERGKRPKSPCLGLAQTMSAMYRFGIPTQMYMGEFLSAQTCKIMQSDDF